MSNSRILAAAILALVPLVFLAVAVFSNYSHNNPAVETAQKNENHHNGDKSVNFQFKTTGSIDQGTTRASDEQNLTVAQAKTKPDIFSAILGIVKSKDLCRDLVKFERMYMDDAMKVDPKKLKEILDKLQNQEVKAALLVALGRIAKDQLAELLIAYTTADEFAVRLASAFALATRRVNFSTAEEQDVQVWLERLKWIRVSDQIGIPPPVQLLAQDVEGVSQAACRENLLRLIQAESEPATQISYLYLLSRSTEFPEVRSVMLRYLANPSDEEYRLHSAQVLAGAAYPDVIAALEDRVKADESPRVRESCIRALGESKDDEALTFLSNMVPGAATIGEKRAIAYALSNSPDVKYSRVLADVVRNEKNDVVIADAISLLATRADEVSFGAIIHALQNAEYGYLKGLAAEKLAALGDRRAIPYLQQALQTATSEGVRESIRKALESLK